MCGSEELIHDARQVDLEEMIMTNETPLYLVPGRLTDEQRERFILDTDCSTAEVALMNLGTPIQPCADVETVCVALPTLYDNLTDFRRAQVFPVSLRSVNGTDIELVRRTDMEAQVARVAAEKDAEIYCLTDALKKMTAIATSRASMQTVEIMVRERTESLRGAIANAAVDLVEGVGTTTVCRNLRAALNEGAGG